MKKKILDIIYACISGIGIGVPITLICMTLIGGFNSVVLEFLTWTVASALFGVLSVLIFRTPNDLTLPGATALHCAGCLLVASAAGAIVGYSDSFLDLLMAILPVFVVVYGILYTVSYLSMKKEAKRINDELNKK